ncbi:hypothetical protein [uncultured Pseudosulfitobacter sp.]|uniref:hypothetical protein n=1 Tax=uncultured Pseudosulfitobacter sp. TaxID=2854214 RepID=UPI0030DB2E3A|tara:strand:- start:1367 stop:1696 length:330 start_codon:yes stop_codon:yes gene_type:complete
MIASKMIPAIEILRRLDPELPMSVLVTFFTLADGEPIEVRDLLQRVDLSSSALNRALTYLGDAHWQRTSKKMGLGLVQQTISPEDRRVRIACLSPKGRAIIKQIEEVLR